MIKIPGQVGWRQGNRGNLLGSIWSSWNLDLQSNLGAIRLAPRLKLRNSTADDAQLGIPVAIKHYGGKNWAICGTSIFTNDGTVSGSFTEDAVTGFQTDYSADESDLELFNGTLCATTTDALYSCDGSNWTSRDVLSSGTAHLMTYFKKFDRLYYSNASDNVISIDSAWATSDPGAAYAISLSSASSSYTITSMKASSTRIWIGVVDENNPAAPGKVIEWDGISADITNEYPLNGPGCLAIAISPVNGNPYVVDGAGILYGFTGSGFKEVARFPLENNLAYNPVDSDNERFIHPNGITFTKNGTILLNVINRPNTTTNAVPESFPSGLWEWSEANGLVHKYSFSYNPTGSSTITDYGQGRLGRAGAVTITDLERNESTADGSILAGAGYYTDASTLTHGIFHDNSLDTIQKNGYFVTTKILSPSVVDAWGKFYLRFKRLLASTDKIVVKYRTTETAPVESAITWVDTTSFTVTAANVPNLAVGDEVEVIRGVGSGKCAHVTAIAGTTTYTVTVDETFTGATTTTATARFQKWTKFLSETSQVKDYITANMDPVRTTWVQFKVFLQFTGKDEVYDIKLDNKSVV